MKKKIIIAVFSILFLLILFLVLFDKFASFDASIYKLVISMRCSFLDHYFTLITKLGNYRFVVLLVGFLIILFHNRYSLFIGFGSLFCVLINSIIKNIVKRDRPNILRLIKQGGYSFPSGHAMISVFLYGFLLYLVLTKIKNKVLKYILSVFLIFIILSIGISRIYLGVHFASDVISGYILSLIYVIILIEIDLGVRKRR